MITKKTLKQYFFETTCVQVLDEYLGDCDVALKASNSIAYMHPRQF